jgi:UMF1 family MFS transporter
VFGPLIPRWSAKRTLQILWLGWIGALAVVAVNPSIRWLWVVGPVIGCCLGSTFATARVLLIELSARDRLAETFGLAGLVARISAILGPVVWGWLVLDPAGSWRGFVFLTGLLAVGVWLLRGVQVPEPQAGG